MDTHKSPDRIDQQEQPSETNKSSLWVFAPLSEYQVPVLPASSAATRTWSSLTRLFGGGSPQQQAPTPDREEPRPLSPPRLDRLAPSPDWSAAIMAFDRTLDDWWRQENVDRPVRFLIGPPYGGHAEMVRRWGAALGAMVVAEPSGEQILAEDARWLADWPGAQPLWVLPHLEWCFLRHANGLSLVRQLLERAESGRLGCGLIGCDSWAWAFLEHVWPVSRPDALSIQAFDGNRLAQLFAAMATPRYGERIQFRNLNNGKDILTAPFAEDEEVGTEIAELAAHSRGTAGLAAALWRRRLCAGPEEAEDTDASTAEEGRTEVAYVEEHIEEVRPSADFGEEEVLLLHALLLHNGLAESLLAQLLPLPSSRTAATLRRLHQGGLVELSDGRWRVAAPACVAVRELLCSRDYLCDSF
ncbi:MAG: hypothetical protein RBT36_06230 [Desulfobulbus sp.]|nr:hypothetical protein [Desulfobulbus sp.]